jgi:hypothetical protein
MKSLIPIFLLVNVVAIVTAGVLKDIHTLVRKQATLVLPPPSPAIQSLSTEGTQDSLSFLVFSTANDVHAPLEPTSQIQEPSNLNESI